VPRFRLTLEYDGRGFMGWQRQAHGPSVQEVVEAAIAIVTGEEVVVHAAGRTDAGVHASAMTAHVEIEKTIAPFRLMEGLNARLRLAGHAVAAVDAASAPADFHARFSCTGRAYAYRIVNRRAPLTWESGLAWRVSQQLDAAAMHDAAQCLLGHHDFTTFRSVHCQSPSPEKTLSRLDVRREGERLTLVVEARSFLHHQVRSMVGALVFVGLGRWTAGDLADALAARDRQRLPLNAPPDGLWFTRADYPKLSA
jgi:tRNA pseudouridine38-40 synthase